MAWFPVLCIILTELLSRMKMICSPKQFFQVAHFLNSFVFHENENTNDDQGETTVHVVYPCFLQNTFFNFWTVSKLWINTDMWLEKASPPLCPPSFCLFLFQRVFRLSERVRRLQAFTQKLEKLVSHFRDALLQNGFLFFSLSPPFFLPLKQAFGAFYTQFV